MVRAITRPCGVSATANGGRAATAAPYVEQVRWLGDQAEPTLLLDGERDRGCHCHAAMLAGGAGTPPIPVGRGEVRAQAGQRPRRRVHGIGDIRWVRRCLRPELNRVHGRRIAERGAETRDEPDSSPSALPQTRKNPGDDLFSRKAALSVSSALESLTSVFGMGTGVASPLESPGFFASGRVSAAARRTSR